MSILSKIPWTLLLIAYLVGAYYLGVEIDGPPAFIFIGLGVFVLFVEFVKSGDISTGRFLTDLIEAVLAVVAATALICYVLFSPELNPELNPEATGFKLNYFHWFGYVIIIGDAILSPFNSFRTALRNFAVGGSGG